MAPTHIPPPRIYAFREDLVGIGAGRKAVLERGEMLVDDVEHDLRGEEAGDEKDAFVGS